MRNEDILKSVINKYKLDEPVPSDVRIAMETSRKESLTRILKEDAERAIFISLAVSFFLWIKKFGLSISIAKSAIAVAAALIIGAGTITAAGVYSTVIVLDCLSDNKQNIEKAEEPKTVSGENKETEAKPVQEIKSFAVAVNTVDMDDAADRSLSEYRNKMIQSLRSIKGPKAAIILENLDEYHTSDKTLSISIIRLDEKSKISAAESVYRISAKIINTANSQVLMYSSVTADGESSIPDSIQKLAEKISAKI
jgi:hypothetical protein